MKKLLGLLILGFICFAGVLFWVGGRQRPQGTISAGDLSERSQQFLKDQAIREEKLSIINTEAAPRQTIEELVDNCFFLKLDWPVENLQVGNDQEPCFIRTDTLDPRSRLTLATKPVTSPLAELSGVTLRLTQTENYDRLEDADMKGEYFQFKTSSGLDTFAIKDGRLITVTFSNAGGTTEKLQQMTRELVEKIEWLGESKIEN